MFQHSKRIRWLQGIVKRWVMKVSSGFVWLIDQTHKWVLQIW